jgi:hypothetical protein
MALSALAVVVWWALVVALARMQPLIPVLLVATSALAVPITLLGLAHLIAFLVRRDAAARGLDAPVPETAPASLPVPAHSKRRREGCC